MVWTAGNVSQRVLVDPDSGPGLDDLFVIKPSGVTYDELTPESMVVCDLDGNLVDGDRAPSSRHRGARLRVPEHAGGRRRRAHALDLRDGLGRARASRSRAC